MKPRYRWSNNLQLWIRKFRPFEVCKASDRFLRPGSKA